MTGDQWVLVGKPLQTMTCEFLSFGQICGKTGLVRKYNYVQNHIRDIDNPQVLCSEHSKLIVEINSFPEGDVA